jgi:hypothetical protein
MFCMEIRRFSITFGHPDRATRVFLLFPIGVPFRTLCQFLPALPAHLSAEGILPIG